MLQTYTARYTLFRGGYMGQLIEWPEVVSEGVDLEECRAMLRDALREMVLTYRDLGRETPVGNIERRYRRLEAKQIFAGPVLTRV